jgi:hypothetical protein
MMRIELAEAVELIQAEYAEMPGLRMTSRQVRRVWSLSTEVCQEALTSLTRSGFLIENRDSSYVKATRVPLRRDADAA